MGTRTAYRDPLAWQATLGGMKDANGRLRLVCTSCKRSRDLDVDMMIADHGPAWSAWDRTEPCPCGALAFYMGWAGAVYVPLRSGRPSADEQRIRHRQLLDRIGLSADDWERIKALAESVAAAPVVPLPTLDDLAQPVRIAAVPTDQVWQYSATPLGTWKGMTLLMWRLSLSERAAWEQRRRFRG